MREEESGKQQSEKLYVTYSQWWCWLRFVGYLSENCNVQCLSCPVYLSDLEWFALHMIIIIIFVRNGTHDTKRFMGE